MGSSHGLAKADDQTVRAARIMREDLRKTYAEIGAALGVPWRTVVDWCDYRTRADA